MLLLLRRAVLPNIQSESPAKNPDAQEATHQLQDIGVSQNPSHGAGC